MAARYKARTVFDSLNTGIVGSNPSRGMDVSTFFCVVLSWVGRGLALGRSAVQGVLPNVKNRFITFRS
jgi:hypothetical protein